MISELFIGGDGMIKITGGDNMSKVLDRITEYDGFDVGSSDITTNYIYRPPTSIVNLLKADAEFIAKFLRCKWDEAITFRFSQETRAFISKLEDVSHYGFERDFFVSGSRWKEKSEYLFTLPNSDVPIAVRDYGLLCRKRDWEKIKGFITSISLSPPSYNPEVLDSVFWTDKTASLKNDVIFFSNSKSWFDKRDLPYSRSYLLYGPPGNGKTSAIRSISNYFSTTPSTFSFTGRYEDPDESFLKWISGDSTEYSMDDHMDVPRPSNGRLFDAEASKAADENPKIRVLLLEDVDRFFSKEEGLKTPVSFSAILNALDGVSQRRNSILIATANNPERIDSQVLCRPGRFDLRVPFEAPSKESMVKYLTKITSDDSISESMIATVAEMSKGHSFAFVKGIYMAAASKSFARGSYEISDSDIESSLNESLSNMGRDIKSNRGGAGF
jgi:hypothetical protein